MPIVFEDVSYSYLDKRDRNRAQLAAAATFSDTQAWGVQASDVWALRDISFTLETGEFLGLVGHTGSGKSTLIQHMNGLLHPTCGRVLFDGNDLADKRVAAACRGKIGMVFQHPEQQLFAATVAEDVAFGPCNLGLKGAEVECRIDEALTAVGLDGNKIRNMSPFELSGGQQRRVALAGVLSMKPQVLVLDEPASGLDPQAHADILDLVTQLHHNGLTIVMASHNMDDLARLADRILVLNKGSISALDTPAHVFAKPKTMRSIGLDVPFAQNLACNLQEEGLPLSQQLYDTSTLADELAYLYKKKAKMRQVCKESSCEEPVSGEWTHEESSCEERAHEEGSCEKDAHRKHTFKTAVNTQELKALQEAVELKDQQEAVETKGQQETVETKDLHA